MEHPAYLAQLWYGHSLGNYYWSRFLHNFNCHLFKSFSFSLIVWSNFTKKWSVFSSFHFRSFSRCGPSFFFILMGLCEICWLLLLCRDRISFFSYFSEDCAGFYFSNNFGSFCYLEIYCALLRKYEEGLFKYHYFFSWNMLVNFSLQHFLTSSIANFNPNNTNIFSTINPWAKFLKNNNISGFHNVRLMQSKHLSPNLKKFLTKAEYGEVLSGTFNCSNKKCEYCN